MELKELRSFMQVARAGSVSRAAQELRLAQPALSRQIKKLEHELGVSLFTRHGRGVRLSAAGSLLLERAEAITQLAQQTGREISERRSPTAGRITLGVPPAAGRLLISPFVERFQRDFPQTTLHIREGVSSSLQEWLLEKRIDIALLHNPPHLETVEISPLLNERMLVIGPPPGRGKARNARAVYRVRDLAELPLILPNMAHSNRRLVEQAAARTRRPPAHQGRGRQRRLRQGAGRTGIGLHHSHLRGGAGRSDAQAAHRVSDRAADHRRPRSPSSPCATSNCPSSRAIPPRCCTRCAARWCAASIGPARSSPDAQRAAVIAAFISALHHDAEIASLESARAIAALHGFELSFIR